jgi:chromosome segregation ATPase
MTPTESINDVKRKLDAERSKVYRRNKKIAGLEEEIDTLRAELESRDEIEEQAEGNLTYGQLLVLNAGMTHLEEVIDADRGPLAKVVRRIGLQADSLYELSRVHGAQSALLRTLAEQCQAFCQVLDRIDTVSGLMKREIVTLRSHVRGVLPDYQPDEPEQEDPDHG